MMQEGRFEFKSLEKHMLDLEQWMEATNPILQIVCDIWGEVASLHDDITLIKKSLAVDPMEKAGVKPRVPKPKAFTGGCDMKELENFLWDIEGLLQSHKDVE